MESAHRIGGNTQASIGVEALLFPRIAVHVVAVPFPVSRFILRQKLEAADPLGTLPAVELRDHQAQRTAMLRLERRAIVTESEQTSGCIRSQSGMFVVYSCSQCTST